MKAHDRPSWFPEFIVRRAADFTKEFSDVLADVSWLICVVMAGSNYHDSAALLEIGLLISLHNGAGFDRRVVGPLCSDPSRLLHMAKSPMYHRCKDRQREARRVIRTEDAQWEKTVTSPTSPRSA